MTNSNKNQLQTTKQQHIVPRCYLQNWCNADGRIHALKMTGLHRSTPSPKSAATRKNIYDTLDTLNPADPENYQIFERTLGRIEDEIPDIFDSIFSNARRLHSSIVIPRECTRISQETADKVTRLAVVQFLRDTRHRDRVRHGWNNWMQQVWDQTVPLFYKPEDEPSVFFESVNEDFLTEWLIEFLKDRLLKFSKVLKTKTMVIGVNKTSNLLLTSDSPVHWTGYYIDASENWDGLNSRSFRMVYPLAPDVCAIFYDPKYYGDQLPYHRCVRVLEHKEVKEFNEFLTADQQIFSRDGDFSQAEFALTQKRLSGEKWDSNRISRPVPEELLELVKWLGHSKEYTKKEWRSLLQFESFNSTDKYKDIQQQLLDAFSKPLIE